MTRLNAIKEEPLSSDKLLEAGPTFLDKVKKHKNEL